MPGSVLLDSNILILASKQKLDINLIVRTYDEIFTSIVAKIEVIGYNFSTTQEQVDLEDFLDTMTVLPLTEDIAQHAIHYRRTRRIKLPDAAILATARHVGADLLTENTADFRSLDPAVRVLSLADLSAAAT
jgi:hypothetical protein